MYHAKYRSDIDGLRAIAILSVVGFHAFPDTIQGGFIGVDIFFVISGFLISGIIFRSLEKNSFNYFEFYIRRIKRIFPALILTLIVTWLIGWFILFPDEFKQLGVHIVGGIGFVSNFILWNEAGYFDNLSDTKPLLHLWSLGIEEQFYIFWPILLGLVWKHRLNFLAVTLIIAGLSFSLCIYALAKSEPVSAFYLPTNRFWELMIGGGLAYIFLHKKTWLLRRKSFLNVLSFLGSLLIVLAIIFLDKDKPFPGWWALLPTIGTFFIISAHGSWINRNIFGNYIFVFIGLISYPLYLWHWALLSFAHILGFDGIDVRIGIVCLSFVLAWLTYEVIEKKIRKTRSLMPFYILVALSLIVVGMGFITSREIMSPRNNTQAVTWAAEAIGDWEWPDGLAKAKINDVRVFLKKGSEKKVLFFGDSFIRQYSPRIVSLIEQDPVNTKTAIFATSGGCPPIPNVYEDQHPSCSSDFRDKIIEYALSPDVDSVVIGASWNYLIKRKKPKAGKYRYYYLLEGEKIYFDESGITYALGSLERMISSISKYKEVFLVIDNPTGPAFNPKSMYEGSRITSLVENKTFLHAYNKNQSDIRAVLIEIAGRSNAKVIDSTAHFCEENKCRSALDNGWPLFRDGNHIRSSYVRDSIEYLDITVKH